MKRLFQDSIPVDTKDYSEYRVAFRKVFVRNLIIIGLPIAGFFVLYHLYRSRHVDAAIVFLMLLCLCALLVDYTRESVSSRPGLHREVFVRLFLFFFLIYLCYQVGFERSVSKAPWFLIVPTLIFFSTNVREALIWTVCVVAVLLYLLFEIDLNFSENELFHLRIRLVVVFTVLCAIVFVTSRLIRSVEKRLFQNQKDLLSKNSRLKEEIEERKHAEQEQKKLETQLRQAYKMESMGTLAGGIAHDFNNILGIILGNTELALYDVPEWNPAQHNLREVRDACIRAKDLVRQILAFTRKTEQELKAVKIGPLVEEGLRLLRASIPKTIEIRHNIAAESDTVMADPTQIHQILMNLCTNAAQAMAQTGGVLEIALVDEELSEDEVGKYKGLTPGRYARLTVSDTGPGIDPSVLDRIFDPYFTTKGPGEGTGMGLSVVHGIMKSHHGSVYVETEVGKGSAFHVLLPKTGEEEISATESLEGFPTGNERILFVDDEAALARMGQLILERLGYQVESKTNPAEALEVFRENSDRFDLVITDMTMPQMTGESLARELMAIRPDIRIVICTGYSRTMDEEKARSLGIRGFIMKPLSWSDIARTVRKVLDEQ